MPLRLRRVLLFAKDFQKHVEAAELLLAELPAAPRAHDGIAGPAAPVGGRAHV